jgi:hypothetical protein
MYYHYDHKEEINGVMLNNKRFGNKLNKLEREKHTLIFYNEIIRHHIKT